MRDDGSLSRLRHSQTPLTPFYRYLMIWHDEAGLPNST